MLRRLVCLLVLSGASGDRSDIQEIVSRLETRFRSARTLEATFLERYTENGRVTRAEAGTVYFRRPGRMRWEYESPEKNLFLVDGKTAWFYVPADHTVTRVPAKESADWRTPLALLVGDTKVSKVCSRVETTAEEKPNTADDVVLRCILRGTEPKHPKGGMSQPSLEERVGEQTVFLEVHPDTGDLVRVLVREGGGVTLEFRFANWRTNPRIADSLFRFDPPVGVAIVNAGLPAGENDKKLSPF
jgi:outer membrane lipoprotein carrier protein